MVFQLDSVHKNHAVMPACSDLAGHEVLRGMHCSSLGDSKVQCTRTDYEPSESATRPENSIADVSEHKQHFLESTSIPALRGVFVFSLEQKRVKHSSIRMSRMSTKVKSVIVGWISCTTIGHPHVAHIVGHTVSLICTLTGHKLPLVSS